MTAAAHSSMASVKAGDTLPAGAYGSPAATPSLTTPAMTPPPTTAPASPTAKPSPTASTSAKASTAAGPSCAPGSIVLSLFTSQASYSQGTRPHFEVYAVSTASTPCQLPYGTGSVQVVVTKKGQVVWDSTSCGSSAAKPVQFQTGVPHMLTISWNRDAKSPSGCAGSLSKGATGTFDAVAMTAGKSSQVRTFQLTS